jgi:hypothetical protein
MKILAEPTEFGPVDIDLSEFGPVDIDLSIPKSRTRINAWTQDSFGRDLNPPDGIFPLIINKIELRVFAMWEAVEGSDLTHPDNWWRHGASSIYRTDYSYPHNDPTGSQIHKLDVMVRELLAKLFSNPAMMPLLRISEKEDEIEAYQQEVDSAHVAADVARTKRDNAIAELAALRQGTSS